MPRRQDEAERLWTVREAADRLRKSPKTILRWIAKGELPAFKVGRQWLVSDPDIRKFLSERRHG